MEIAASLLSADFTALGEQVREAMRADVARLHIDVMDGHFVPNLSMGPHVVRCLRHLTEPRPVTLDVHLMVSQPGEFVGMFVEAGASAMSVHVEAATHLARLVAQIRELGVEAGAALNPATPLSALDEILPELDFVLLMTVNPGFAGQRLLPWTLSKIERLRRLLDERGLSRTAIQVDGGVHHETIGQVARAGADRAVAGSAVFGGPDSVADNVRRLREAARAKPV